MVEIESKNNINNTIIQTTSNNNNLKLQQEQQNVNNDDENEYNKSNKIISCIFSSDRDHKNNIINEKERNEQLTEVFNNNNNKVIDDNNHNDHNDHDHDANDNDENQQNTNKNPMKVISMVIKQQQQQQPYDDNDQETSFLQIQPQQQLTNNIETIEKNHHINKFTVNSNDNNDNDDDDKKQTLELKNEEKNIQTTTIQQLQANEPFTNNTTTTNNNNNNNITTNKYIENDHFISKTTSNLSTNKSNNNNNITNNNITNKTNNMINTNNEDHDYDYDHDDVEITKNQQYNNEMIMMIQKLPELTEHSTITATTTTETETETLAIPPPPPQPQALALLPHLITEQSPTEEIQLAATLTLVENERSNCLVVAHSKTYTKTNKNSTNLINYNNNNNKNCSVAGVCDSGGGSGNSGGGGGGGIINISSQNNNKYTSLVMITQNPVSLLTNTQPQQQQQQQQQQQNQNNNQITASSSSSSSLTPIKNSPLINSPDGDDIIIISDDENTNNNTNKNNSSIITSGMASTTITTTAAAAAAADVPMPPQVSIVATDTTQIISNEDSVIVQHTNLQQEQFEYNDHNNDQIKINSLADYFNYNLEHDQKQSASSSASSSSPSTTTKSPRRPIKITTNSSAIVNNNNNNNNNSVINNSVNNNNNNNNLEKLIISNENSVILNESGLLLNNNNNNNNSDSGYSASDGVNSRINNKIHNNTSNDDVTIVTGSNTLSSAIIDSVCLEDGLADDDSWVEEISQDEDEFTAGCGGGTTTTTATTTATNSSSSTATDSDCESPAEDFSMCSAADREDELRGYNRTAIDFTLHTIVEESCEDSEFDQEDHLNDHDDDDDGRGNDKRNNSRAYRKNRISASELEKYFFYGLANDDINIINNSNQMEGSSSSLSSVIQTKTMDNPNEHEQDQDDDDDDDDISISDSSSLCSEGIDSLGGNGNGSGTMDIDYQNSDLSASHLEKYFLTGFMGFSATENNHNNQNNKYHHHHHHHHHHHSNDSDGSEGSVGSDSEGRPSPEQRRKRLVRARGTPRSQNSSLDNLLAATAKDENSDTGGGGGGGQTGSSSGGYQTDKLPDSLGNTSDTDTCEETVIHLDKSFDSSQSSNNNDTLKRKKQNKKKIVDTTTSTPVIAPMESSSPSDLTGNNQQELDIQNITMDTCSKTTSSDYNVLPIVVSNLVQSKSQHSRDSGFIGSNDDLLKSDEGPQQHQPQIKGSNVIESKTELSEIEEDLLEQKDTLEENRTDSISTSVENINLPSSNDDGTNNTSVVVMAEVITPSTPPPPQLPLQPPPSMPVIPPTSSSSQSQSQSQISLSRKDSFNNWSSDEETNLMMSKMRQFFKTLVAASANTQNMTQQQHHHHQSYQNIPTKFNAGGGTPSIVVNQTLTSDSYKQSNSKQLPLISRNKMKPPQLVYFENELTRLMKTVPGIKDEQVRELVEYLSSEDTWSDSYDSSDYTSSDIENGGGGGAVGSTSGVPRKSELQQQISASCQQIIKNFDSNIVNLTAIGTANPTTTTSTTTTTTGATMTSSADDEEGDLGDGGVIIEDNLNNVNNSQMLMNRETALVYQKLVASFSKMATTDAGGANNSSSAMDHHQQQQQQQSNNIGDDLNDQQITINKTQPIFAKVMSHIGTRLVALMHEVSSGESHTSGTSPRLSTTRYHHKRLQAKLSNPTSTTTTTTSTAATSTASTTTTEEEDNENDDHNDDDDDDDDDDGDNSNFELEKREGLGVLNLPRSKSHDLLLSGSGRPMHHQSSSGVSDTAADEKEHSDCERFSWRGSFESALLANGDSRTKLTLLDSRDNSASASALAAKRRSAGDLLFNHNLSREQLDRVRSCGSIGHGSSTGNYNNNNNNSNGNGNNNSIPEDMNENMMVNKSSLWKSMVLNTTKTKSQQTLSMGSGRRRRSSVPDNSVHLSDENDTSSSSSSSSSDDDELNHNNNNRNFNKNINKVNSTSKKCSTLPRSLQNVPQSSSFASSSSSLIGDTNSLPRLSSSTTNLQSTSSSSGGGVSVGATIVNATNNVIMQKSQSAYHFVPNSSSAPKSARYRPPGFNRLLSNVTQTTSSSPASPTTSTQKKAISTPGLAQSLYTKKDTRRRAQSLYTGESTPAERASSPIIGVSPNAANANKALANAGGAGAGVSGTSSAAAASRPISPAQLSSTSSTDPWPSQADEDIDRLVAMHQNRSSLSSLGIRSDSMASVYSGAGEGRYGTVTVKGQIEFGMQYNYKQGALEIHIVKCKELAAVDTKRQRSDPYVKLYLLPDKSKGGKRKTKVKKHTLNPIFDETLKFYMSLNGLDSRTLWVTVWHSDMFGRNDFLGEVTIPLRGKVFDNTQPQWYLLQERTEPFDDLLTAAAYKGDIIVGLKFIPPTDGGAASHHHHHTLSSFALNADSSTSSSNNSLNIRKFGNSIKSSMTSSPRNSATLSALTSTSKGSLHVLVKEGKNLSAIKANGTCDAFCKSYLLPDKSRSSKQKTAVVKRSINPIWNYTFVYENVSLAELSERALELTVWDHDRLASNEFLGGVRFSLGTSKYQDKTVDWMDSTGKELSLWQSMLNRPNFWVEGGVMLRSTLDNGIRYTNNNNNNNS